MKVLLDEMWPAWIAQKLRELGHDVIAVKEDSDLVGKTDRHVFDSAQSQGRAVLTDNVRDYALLARQLLQKGESHSGLIFTSNRSLPRAKPSTFTAIVERLDDLINDRQQLTDQEHWL